MRNALLNKTLGQSSIDYSSQKSYDRAKSLVGNKSKAFMDKKYAQYKTSGYSDAQARKSAISAVQKMLENKDKDKLGKMSLEELTKIRKELAKTKAVRLKIGD